MNSSSSFKHTKLKLTHLLFENFEKKNKVSKQALRCDYVVKTSQL